MSKILARVPYTDLVDDMRCKRVLGRMGVAKVRGNDARQLAIAAKQPEELHAADVPMSLSHRGTDIRPSAYLRAIPDIERNSHDCDRSSMQAVRRKCSYQAKRKLISPVRGVARPLSLPNPASWLV